MTLTLSDLEKAIRFQGFTPVEENGDLFILQKEKQIITTLQIEENKKRVLVRSHLQSLRIDESRRAGVVEFFNILNGHADLYASFYVDHAGGVEAWAVNNSIPEVGYYPIILPGVVDFAGINLHPGNAGPTIVGWRSPVSGQVTAAGFFTESNPAQASGITWFVSQGSTTLQSGTLPPASTTVGTFQQTVSVNAGDFLYFIVASLNGAVGFDTTHLELTISSGAATGPLVLGQNGTTQLSVSGGELTLTDSSGSVLVENGAALATEEAYCPFCGQPVNIANGTLYHKLSDFDLKGRSPSTHLALERTYLSHPIFTDGDFGPNWFSNWETQIIAEDSSATPNLIWIDQNGGAFVFKRNADGSFLTPPGTFGTLVEASDHYELDQPHGIKYIFSKNASTAPFGRLLTISEPHGEAVNLSYGTNGKLLSISTGLAGTVTYSRDANGHVIQVLRNRDNLAYSYIYGAAGNMLSANADFDGNTTAYTYSSVGSMSGLLATLTDPIGRTLSFQYDSMGRASSQTVYGGGTLTFAYSSNSTGPVTVVKDIDGQTSTYQFNGQYLLTQVTQPDGSNIYETWTSQNQMATSTDELGFTTSYTYNSHGDMTSIKKPLDPSPTEIAYDPSFDQILSITPLVGAPTLAQVNSSNGDILQISRAAGSTTLIEKLSYNAFGSPISFNNGLSTFSNQTDANGLLTFVYDLRNPETRTYDNRGRVTNRSFKSGKNLIYTWDNHDRLTRVDDSTGPSVLFTYDVMNRILSKTVTDGKTNEVTQYTWDQRDRLLSQVDALGNKKSFEYDFTSNGVISIIDMPREKIDGNGNVTSFSFDNRDRVVRKTDAKGGVTQFQYNLRGDRTVLIDPLNQKTTFSFDGNRRLTSESRPSAVTSSNGKTTASVEVLNYFYDLNGKLIRIEKPSLLQGGMSVIILSFDNFDRLIEKSEKRLDKNGNISLVEDDSTFTYSPELDKELVTSANNSVENLSFNFDPAPPFAPVAYSAQAKDPKNTLGLIQDQYSVNYDGTNQIQSIVNSQGKNGLTSSHDEAGRLLEIASGNILGEHVLPLSISLKYDSFGRKSAVSASDHTSGSMVYDLDNRISQINWQTSGLLFSSNKVSEALSYDHAGNILAQTREFGKISYGYDPDNEVISAEAKGSVLGFLGLIDDLAITAALTQKYSYDLAGNRTLASDSGTSQFIDNQIVSNSKSTFESDPDGYGNLSSESLSNPAHFSRNYTYRTDGKMTAMNIAFDDQYRCDPSVQQVVTQTLYYFDALGRRVAKQNTVKPNILGRFGSPLSYTQSFSYLVNENKILLAKGGDGNLSLYLDGQRIDEHLGRVSKTFSQAFFTDHLGSVLNSTMSGLLQAYDVYGQTAGGVPVIAAILSSDPVLYGFAGREFDLESAKYYNRARMYDPSTGRFMNQDPTGLRGGLNLYRYAKNNPQAYLDPTGNCALLATLGILGAFYSAYQVAEFINGLIDEGIDAGVVDQYNAGIQNINDPLLQLAAEQASYSYLQQYLSDVGADVPGTSLNPGPFSQNNDTDSDDDDDDDEAS